MSMYFFAVCNGKGVPDKELLALMSHRMEFKRVLCPAEEADAGARLAKVLGIDCVICQSLSDIQPDETDISFKIRLKNEWEKLYCTKENAVVLLPQNVMCVMMDLPFVPQTGYAEVK